MPTNTSWWAVACLCSELLAAAQPGRCEAAAEPCPRALELEVQAASQSDLYLVISLPDRALLIKARGLELHRMPLKDVALLIAKSATPEPVPLELPLAWTVARTYRGGYRRLLTPPPVQSESSPPGASAPVIGRIELPEEFQIELSGGWSLAVSSAAAKPRLGERIALGSRVWLASITEDRSPPLLQVRLSMAPEDARRFFHVVHRGQRILMTP